MVKGVQEKLLVYYYDSKLRSYIFSSDIRAKLEGYDVTQTDWFLKNISDTIYQNKEFEIFSENSKNNCLTLLNHFRNSHTLDEKVIEKCNELFCTLNTSGSQNWYDYLVSLYLNSSFDSKKSAMFLKTRRFEESDFEGFFETASDVACLLLLAPNPDEQVNVAFNMAANEFYFNILVDITKFIPEILEDEELFSSLYSVLEINSTITVQGEPLHKCSKSMYLKNIKAKKYMKKRINF